MNETVKNLITPQATIKHHVARQIIMKRNTLHRATLLRCASPLTIEFPLILLPLLSARVRWRFHYSTLLRVYCRLRWKLFWSKNEEQSPGRDTVWLQRVSAKKKLHLFLHRRGPDSKWKREIWLPSWHYCANFSSPEAIAIIIVQDTQSTWAWKCIKVRMRVAKEEITSFRDGRIQIGVRVSTWVTWGWVGEVDREVR